MMYLIQLLGHGNKLHSMAFAERRPPWLMAQSRIGCLQNDSSLGVTAGEMLLPPYLSIDAAAAGTAAAAARLRLAHRSTFGKRSALLFVAERSREVRRAHRQKRRFRSGNAHTRIENGAVAPALKLW